MSIIGVASTRSSPGATSLTVGLALSWHLAGRTPHIVEADPAGGVLGLRFGLSSEASLQTLRADMRRGLSTELVRKNSTPLLDVPCLLAPTDPVLATRTLDRTAGLLAEGLDSFERPVLADLGRLFERSPALPFARHAGTVLLVVRPRVDDVQSLLFGTRLLRAQNCRVSLVVIGDEPFHPAEVADLADVPLAAVLPDDRCVASAFGGGRFTTRTLLRTSLWRAVDSLGRALLDDLDERVPPEPPPQFDTHDASGDERSMGRTALDGIRDGEIPPGATTPDEIPSDDQRSAHATVPAEAGNA